MVVVVVVVVGPMVAVAVLASLLLEATIAPVTLRFTFALRLIVKFP